MDCPNNYLHITEWQYKLRLTSQLESVSSVLGYIWLKYSEARLQTKFVALMSKATRNRKKNNDFKHSKSRLT